MSHRLFFDRNPDVTIESALRLYSGKEFRSPARSTIPLLSLLRDGVFQFNEILSSVGIPSACEVHLEYTVAPPLGKGIPSHTDAMVISEETSLAIEAKWTEPRYKTVAEWLQQGSNPDNRRAVVSGWLKLLQRVTGTSLTIECISSAIYQMVHRAASACAAGQRPNLLYLQFTPLPTGEPAVCQHLQEDLLALHNFLGSPKNFPFFLATVEVRPKQAYSTISGLSKGSSETARQVIAAMNRDRLFDFSLLGVHRIQAVAS